MAEKKRVLMICLGMTFKLILEIFYDIIINVIYLLTGNICRSPIAEAVFADYIAKNNLTDKWEVDSAALIGYHTGKSPDSRAMSTLKDKGIKNYSHRARPVRILIYFIYVWSVLKLAIKLANHTAKIPDHF